MDCSSYPCKNRERSTKTKNSLFIDIVLAPLSRIVRCKKTHNKEEPRAIEHTNLTLEWTRSNNSEWHVKIANITWAHSVSVGLHMRNAHHKRVKQNCQQSRRYKADERGRIIEERRIKRMEILAKMRNASLQHAISRALSVATTPMLQPTL